MRKRCARCGKKRENPRHPEPLCRACWEEIPETMRQKIEANRYRHRETMRGRKPR